VEGVDHPTTIDLDEKEEMASRESSFRLELRGGYTLVGLR